MESNGVKFIKKNENETQEEFKDRVLDIYHNFVLEFFLDDGKYKNFYLHLIARESEWGDQEGYKIKTSVTGLMTNYSLAVGQVALNRDEIIVPDREYFVALCDEYEKSYKTTSEIVHLIDEYSAALGRVNDSIRSEFDIIRKSMVKIEEDEIE